jgi:hypothetical protein
MKPSNSKLKKIVTLSVPELFGKQIDPEALERIRIIASLTNMGFSVDRDDKTKLFSVKAGGVVLHRNLTILSLHQVEKNLSKVGNYLAYLGGSGTNH